MRNYQYTYLLPRSALIEGEILKYWAKDPDRNVGITIYFSVWSLLFVIRIPLNKIHYFTKTCFLSMEEQGLGQWENTLHL